MQKMYDLAALENLRQADSKDEYVSVLMSETVKADLKMAAIPPPRPVVRGIFIKVKPSGVKELRTQGGESDDNHVSVRNRKSRELSEINS